MTGTNVKPRPDLSEQERAARHKALLEDARQRRLKMMTFGPSLLEVYADRAKTGRPHRTIRRTLRHAGLVHKDGTLTAAGAAELKSAAALGKWGRVGRVLG